MALPISNRMKVILLQDVARLGRRAEIKDVPRGHALNFLIPRNLAVEIIPGNEKFYQKKMRGVENRKKTLESKTSMLAEKISKFKLTLKRKMHDDGKLYGSVSQSEIVDLLVQEGIKIAKNQVLFDKSIKERGTYDITIKLSNALQPKFALRISSE